MIPSDLVDLSRLQFALTAMYHFIFVPLTLGLSFMLVVMELAYVISGKQMYKDMTRFWGKLFGINFAIGVATGLTMEFQFGTNWAYYSHYVGDIFGAPLAIEGLLLGIDFYWSVLLRLGPPLARQAPLGHIFDGFGVKPLRALDFGCQRLDDESDRG